MKLINVIKLFIATLLIYSAWVNFLTAQYYFSQKRYLEYATNYFDKQKVNLFDDNNAPFTSARNKHKVTYVSNNPKIMVVKSLSEGEVGMFKLQLKCFSLLLFSNAYFLLLIAALLFKQYNRIFIYSMVVIVISTHILWIYLTQFGFEKLYAVAGCILTLCLNYWENVKSRLSTI